MKIDIYVGRDHPRPALYCDKGNNVTELVYKKLKKRAPHLLQYFVMRFDERGRSYFNVEVPPAFKGYIINQINEVMHHAD